MHLIIFGMQISKFYLPDGLAILVAKKRDHQCEKLSNLNFSSKFRQKDNLVVGTCSDCILFFYYYT